MRREWKEFPRHRPHNGAGIIAVGVLTLSAEVDRGVASAFDSSAACRGIWYIPDCSHKRLGVRTKSSQVLKSSLQHLSGGIHVVTLLRRFRVRLLLPIAASAATRCQQIEASLGASIADVMLLRECRPARPPTRSRRRQTIRSPDCRPALDAADRPWRDLAQPAESHAHHQGRPGHPVGSSLRGRPYR